MMQAFLVGMEWFPNRAGGLNRYFYSQVHALPAANVGGIALVSYVRSGQRAPLELRAMASEGASLPIRLRGARRAASQSLREGVDIVNAHFALYAYPWVRRVPKEVPLVVHFHGPWAAEMSVETPRLRDRARVRMAQAIERSVYRRASRIITLSQAFQDIARQQYGLAQEQLRIVPGGVDTAPYLAAPDRRAARERLGWPQDRRILLSVRRLARRMGLEGLIEAVDTVRRAHPDVLLLIGGKGAIAQELEALIQKRGLQEHARLLGFVADEDLPLAYAAADITLVPTLALEGFGLVTVESLASGTPVMGTPVGGTPEILRGLEPQLIFDSPAPEAMSAAIIRALDGQIPLPERDMCRAFAARYSWDAVVPKIRAVFEEARSA